MTGIDTATAAGLSGQTAAPRAAKSAATAASDFQSFLKLLTAQLRNQDPLSPLDSTQFVEQLASFSSVEQQIETNRLLEELAGSFRSAGLETVTPWIGKTATVEATGVAFTGAPLTLAFPDSAYGAPSEIVVRDANGNAVYRGSVPAGATEFVWNGETIAGPPAASGKYAFVANYSDGEKTIASAPLLFSAPVVEARLVDGAPRLVLDGGAIVDPAAVISVRDGAAE
ncbi:flagellar hook assembly protein FlgD [Amphiplicatus metriothermophilus]|uniref:Basal-body rod modification protein FlgD n=1 Tax=Amphiplicatus metriothermophilus TaxID=1519374 RepID=A0A239PLV8_9PROT|nr:flagellar hook capping FlgD N-terminal domain-containing protein [Amphiplicatus metriothermophilus]MBB5517321.1 flagellar basal-body rod modification protein FlgD [Amphiplicatus metriothermophilus]SNT68343.1 flagellar basal-body rod modification protein FlgD [Amphiplicatus metriothermophilus]